MGDIIDFLFRIFYLLISTVFWVIVSAFAWIGVFINTINLPLWFACMSTGWMIVTLFIKRDFKEELLHFLD
ncbi:MULTISPECIES: hypothetical protein [unclassified Paenibacillus]|uniref:hypothetical protein n=1 Tax=unclassified Paenibacillus TaxID=185978 RepID=UPI001EF5E787|nr:MULTISPECIES: hypothetical protein [unclassified Paenibacillus]MDK8179357.1 hypothetical protein [Paenibacillus sp. UMB4589-SE434]